MGKPKIISADNEIINALYENGVLYQEFEGITLFRTSAHELNKNAIVEHMIGQLNNI
jgi:precorrin-4 methylase